MSKETDKELLVLAAKAAGVPLVERIGLHKDYVADDRAGNEWNPLTDDGDALQLAVKLYLEIAPACYSQDCVDVYSKDDNPVSELFNGDPYAATRRAIVRAAAEIGRKL